jgi:hypothetical protein
MPVVTPMSMPAGTLPLEPNRTASKRVSDC